MASIPPRKMQSMVPHWNSLPMPVPKSSIDDTVAMVAMMGEAPIFRIFLKEKSSPKENSRNITPISAQR